MGSKHAHTRTHTMRAAPPSWSSENGRVETSQNVQGGETPAPCLMRNKMFRTMLDEGESCSPRAACKVEKQLDLKNDLNGQSPGLQVFFFALINILGIFQRNNCTKTDFRRCEKLMIKDWLQLFKNERIKREKKKLRRPKGSEHIKCVQSKTE